MLEGFNTYIEEKRTVVVRRELSDYLKPALMHNIGCTPAESGGRGMTVAFPLDHGEGIMRYYQHGGALGPLRGDRYFSNRALSELRIMEYLFQQSFPVPEPLGIAWTAACPGYRACAIATRRLEAQHLQDSIESNQYTNAILEDRGRHRV